MSLELVENSVNSVVADAGVLTDARSRQLAGLRPFPPGTSGNRSGRPKGIFSKATLKQLRIEVAAGVQRLDCVVDGIIEQAIKGDVSAATFIRDTVDGKPTTPDSDNGPVSIDINIAMIGGGQ